MRALVLSLSLLLSVCLPTQGFAQVGGPPVIIGNPPPSTPVYRARS